MNIAQIPEDAFFRQLDITVALAKTVGRYEAAIDGLKRGMLASLVRSGWHEYGMATACRLCRILFPWPGNDPEWRAGPFCRCCPISVAGDPYGCTHPDQGGPTFGRLKSALQRHTDSERTRGELLEAFEARLTWILTAAHERGYRFSKTSLGHTSAVMGPDCGYALTTVGERVVMRLQAAQTQPKGQQDGQSGDRSRLGANSGGSAPGDQGL